MKESHGGSNPIGLLDQGPTIEAPGDPPKTLTPKNTNNAIEVCHNCAPPAHHVPRELLQLIPRGLGGLASQRQDDVAAPQPNSPPSTRRACIAVLPPHSGPGAC